MKEIKVLPSLLSADLSNLSRDVAAVEGCGVGALHCDIMDGHFVPNITFGPMVVEAVRRLTDLPLNVHLMIEQPERYIEQFAKAGATQILVHAEACIHLHRVLQSIRALGVSPGVALNPSTPLDCLEYVLDDLDSILIMTVNPGFGGQSFIEAMVEKIARTRQMARADTDISVDGGMDVHTVPRVVRAGANLLVAGSSVFASGRPPADACVALQKAAASAIAGREV